MVVCLPTHFFISEGVLTEAHQGKRKKELNPSGISFFLLIIKHRLPNREFFIEFEVLNEYITQNKKETIQPWAMDSLQPVRLITNVKLSKEEYVIRLASRIATRKSPEPIVFLVTPQEKSIYQK